MRHKPALLWRWNNILPISKERTRIPLQQLQNSCSKYCRTNDSLTAVVQHAGFAILWKINCAPGSRFQPVQPHGALALHGLVFAKRSHLMGAAHTSLRRELVRIKHLQMIAKAILPPGSGALSMCCVLCTGGKFCLSVCICLSTHPSIYRWCTNATLKRTGLCKGADWVAAPRLCCSVGFLTDKLLALLTTACWAASHLLSTLWPAPATCGRLLWILS